MNETGQEQQSLKDYIKQEARKALEAGQKIIDAQGLTPDDNGFYVATVIMGAKNPEGEDFIQSCGFLAQWGEDAVFFPEINMKDLKQEDERELSIEEIMNMELSRQVGWNPEMLQQLVQS